MGLEVFSLREKLHFCVENFDYLRNLTFLYSTEYSCTCGEKRFEKIKTSLYNETTQKK